MRFYSETFDRNICFVSQCLTWQMVGERRSSRLSLSVRWSIPVPIVSPVHSLKTTRRWQTKLGRYFSALVAIFFVTLRLGDSLPPDMSHLSIHVDSRCCLSFWIGRCDGRKRGINGAAAHMLREMKGRWTGGGRLIIPQRHRNQLPAAVDTTDTFHQFFWVDKTLDSRKEKRITLSTFIAVLLFARGRAPEDEEDDASTCPLLPLRAEHRSSSWEEPLSLVSSALKTN